MYYDVKSWEQTWKDRRGGLGDLQFARREGPDNQTYEGYNWITGREIRVFKELAVSPEVVYPVVTGLRDLIEEIGLDIEVKYFGNDAELNRQITKYTAPDIARKVGGPTVNILDGYGLSRELLTEDWRRHKPHANVIITDKYLKLGKQHWGQSVFDLGTAIFSLPGPRQNAPEQIYRISKHEGGHLLGYGIHHDTHQVKGYEEPGDCVMNWQASTDKLCNKCKNAITNFWEGAENRMNQRFFREEHLLIYE